MPKFRVVKSRTVQEYADIEAQTLADAEAIVDDAMGDWGEPTVQLTWQPCEQGDTQEGIVVIGRVYD